MKYQAKSLCFQRRKGMKGTEIYKTLGGLESVDVGRIFYLVREFRSSKFSQARVTPFSDKNGGTYLLLQLNSGILSPH